jgi:hypothetical protein
MDGQSTPLQNDTGTVAGERHNKNMDKDGKQTKYENMTVTCM